MIISGPRTSLKHRNTCFRRVRSSPSDENSLLNVQNVRADSSAATRERRARSTSRQADEIANNSHLLHISVKSSAGTVDRDCWGGSAIHKVQNTLVKIVRCRAT